MTTMSGAGRRNFLRLAVTGCAFCLAAGRAGAAETSNGAAGAKAAHPHWSYAGDTGPEHWGELQPDFKVCQLGLEQTPIDLDDAMKGAPGSIALDYKPLPLRSRTTRMRCRSSARGGSRTARRHASLRPGRGDSSRGAW